MYVRAHCNNENFAYQCTQKCSRELALALLFSAGGIWNTVPPSLARIIRSGGEGLGNPPAVGPPSVAF